MSLIRACAIPIIFWNQKPFRKLKLDFASFKFAWQICKSGAQHRCAPNLKFKKKNICRHDDVILCEMGVCAIKVILFVHFPNLFY